MTKEEAQKKADELNNTIKSAFCPLINDLCRTDCYCWVPAKVFTNSSFESRVTSHYCDNAMFSGRTK